MAKKANPISRFFRELLEQLTIQAIWQTLLQGGFAMLIAGVASFATGLQIWEKAILAFALFIILMGIMLGILYRIRARRKQNRALVAARIPYLAELAGTLAKIHKRTTDVSISLETKKVSQQVIENCNREYVRLVKSGHIEKPYAFTEYVDPQLASRIIRKASRKVKNPLDKRLLAAIGQVSEIMERHRIGIRPYLDKDQEYLALNGKLIEQRARVEPKSAGLISTYLYCSYGVNNMALILAYSQKTILKNIKDLPPELSRPVPSCRADADSFMFKLLAEIEDEIIRSVS